MAIYCAAAERGVLIEKKSLSVKLKSSDLPVARPNRLIKSL